MATSSIDGLVRLLETHDDKLLWKYMTSGYDEEEITGLQVKSQCREFSLYYLTEAMSAIVIPIIDGTSHHEFRSGPTVVERGFDVFSWNRRGPFPSFMPNLQIVCFPGSRQFGGMRYTQALGNLRDWFQEPSNQIQTTKQQILFSNI